MPAHLIPALQNLDRDLAESFQRQLRVRWTHSSTALDGNTLDEIEVARKRTRDWLEDEFTVTVSGGKYAIYEAQKNLVLHAREGDARSGVATKVGEDFPFEGQHGSDALSAPERAHRTRTVRLAAVWSVTCSCRYYRGISLH